MTPLPDWVADPRLEPVWARVRRRFEQAGLLADGRVRVELGSRDVRRAVGDLLGRSITTEALTLDLAVLDDRLRQRVCAGGLAEVLERLGGPLQDRPAQRRALVESQRRPLELARDLVDTPWAADWVAGLRRTGLLTGRGDAEEVVRGAALVLVDLLPTEDDRRPQSRVELAARLLGDSHALDRDRVLHQVVVRGLAAAHGVPLPVGSAEREALWASAGVEPDLVSRTCLVRGLRPGAAGSDVGDRLDLAAASGDPVHLTEWDLRRLGALRPAADTRVLVCENPRVVEAIAEARVDGWAVVCTSGEPNLVVHRVLTDLAEADVDLRYHGDFDWPGVAIANRVVDRYRARPWRMAIDDYVRGLRTAAPRLRGSPVEPVWDAELGAGMRHHDRVVHEETVLAELLTALSGNDGREP